MRTTTLSKFRLSHLDAFYSNGILESFLTALSRMISAGEVPASEIELEFINGEPDRNTVRKLWLEGSVIYTNAPRTYRSQVNYLSKASAILFIQRGAHNGYVPEKFFELLTVRKPILALVPNPIAYEDYVAQDPALHVVSNRQTQEISAAFLEMHRAWKEEPADILESVTIVGGPEWSPEPAEIGAGLAEKTAA